MQGANLCIQLRTEYKLSSEYSDFLNILSKEINLEVDEKIIIAVPKGRVLPQVMDFLQSSGIEPEEEFAMSEIRKLRFKTNNPAIDLIRVRDFDVATFVSFGAAQIGFAGRDVLMEFDYSEIYSPLDLGIGKCSLIVAEPEELMANDDPTSWSHVRVATKYPRITRKYFAERGVQAECIKLNGAMELAPSLGLCRRIVDLVETGETLKANKLVEVEKIADISTCLVANRAALKTKPESIGRLISIFTEIAHGKTT